MKGWKAQRMSRSGGGSESMQWHTRSKGYRAGGSCQMAGGKLSLKPESCNILEDHEMFCTVTIFAIAKFFGHASSKIL